MKFHLDWKINGVGFDSQEDLHQHIRVLITSNSEVENQLGVFLSEWFNDLKYIISETSGSTGIPKKTKLYKVHMINSAFLTADFLALKEKHTALLCLPIKYIAAKMMIVRSIVLGLDLDISNVYSNPLDIGSKYYDFCAMVPYQVFNSKDRLDRIKTLIIGGSKINDELKSIIRGLENTRVYETFGMTETVSHIALKQISPFEKKYFETLPGIDIYKDNFGCLVVRTPALSNEPICTKDIINITSKNSFEWLGRLDNVVNSGSIKIIPESIEHKIKGIIKTPFFIGGMPDSQLGQRLVLVLESESNINKSDLLDRIKILIDDKYRVPKDVFFIKKFLRTASGKIKRASTLNEIFKI